MGFSFCFKVKGYFYKRNKSSNNSGLNKQEGNSPAVSGTVGGDALCHAVFKDPGFFLIVALPSSGILLVTGLDLGLAKPSVTASGKGKVSEGICVQCSKSI